MCVGNNFSVLRKNALKVGGFGEDLYRRGQDFRIPNKCAKYLGIRLVANVRAFGSHIPSPEDNGGKKGGVNLEKNDRTPEGKLKCLFTLISAYRQENMEDKAMALVRELELIKK